MTKKYLFIIFLLVSGCSMINKVSNLNLPAWYVNPSQNNSNSLYGVGEGFTIREASKSALSNLSSKLLTNISSTSSSIVEENNYSFNEENRQKINQRVAEVSFSNYQISNSHRSDITFYAEVKVDRFDFIKDQKSILSQNHKIMRNLYKSSKGKNILIRRNKLYKIKGLVAKCVITNQILEGLRSNPDFKKNLDKYQFYHESYDKILDKIEFFVKSNNKKVKNIITKGLSDNKLKVATVKNSGKNTVILDIKSDSTLKNIYGSNIINLKVKFKLLSGNKILDSNIIEVTGASPGSKNDAMNMAIRNLANKVKKEGVLKIIGISEDE